VQIESFCGRVKGIAELVVGRLVVDVGVEGYYPVMTIEELFEKYDK
jgi:hypothetical protein